MTSIRTGGKPGKTDTINAVASAKHSGQPSRPVEADPNGEPIMLAPNEIIVNAKDSQNHLEPLVDEAAKTGTVSAKSLARHVMPIIKSLVKPKGLESGGAVDNTLASLYPPSQPTPFDDKSQEGFEGGGLIQGVKDLFTDKNVLRNRREVEEMKAGTYKTPEEKAPAEEVKQPDMTPPSLGNTYRALRDRKAQIDAASGYEAGGVMKPIKLARAAELTAKVNNPDSYKPEAPKESFAHMLGRGVSAAGKFIADDVVKPVNRVVDDASKAADKAVDDFSEGYKGYDDGGVINAPTNPVVYGKKPVLYRKRGFALGGSTELVGTDSGAANFMQNNIQAIAGAVVASPNTASPLAPAAATKPADTLTGGTKINNDNLGGKLNSLSQSIASSAGSGQSPISSFGEDTHSKIWNGMEKGGRVKLLRKRGFANGGDLNNVKNWRTADYREATGTEGGNVIKTEEAPAPIVEEKPLTPAEQDKEAKENVAVAEGTSNTGGTFAPTDAENAAAEEDVRKYQEAHKEGGIYGGAKELLGQSLSKLVPSKEAVRGVVTPIVRTVAGEKGVEALTPTAEKPEVKEELNLGKPGEVFPGAGLHSELEKKPGYEEIPGGVQVGENYIKAAPGAFGGGAERVMQGFKEGRYKMTPDTPEEIAAAKAKSEANIAAMDARSKERNDYWAARDAAVAQDRKEQLVQDRINSLEYGLRTRPEWDQSKNNADRNTLRALYGLQNQQQMGQEQNKVATANAKVQAENTKRAQEAAQAQNAIGNMFKLAELKQRGDIAANKLAAKGSTEKKEKPLVVEGKRYDPESGLEIMSPDSAEAMRKGKEAEFLKEEEDKLPWIASGGQKDAAAEAAKKRADDWLSSNVSVAGPKKSAEPKIGEVRVDKNGNTGYYAGKDANGNPVWKPVGQK